MDGYRAYKFYAALKLHFTTVKYDVIKTRGRLNYSRERYNQRNDRQLFESIGRHFTQDRPYIEYIAANFMYGNSNVIYGDISEAIDNHKLYTRRVQSMTHVFAQDVNKMIDVGATTRFTGRKIPDVIQLWLANKISIETVVILNHFDNFIPKLRAVDQINLLLDKELLLVDKASKFVKYNVAKVTPIYISLTEELQGTNHGQDVS